jgi:hypothetical protein
MLQLDKHEEELEKESETVDTKDIRWKVMTKGCESKGRISGRGEVGLPLMRCSVSLQRNSGRRPGYKRESPDYQRSCFVYTAEKALLKHTGDERDLMMKTMMVRNRHTPGGRQISESYG